MSSLSNYEYLIRAPKEELVAIIDYLETKVERLEGLVESLEEMLEDKEDDAQDV